MTVSSLFLVMLGSATLLAACEAQQAATPKNTIVVKDVATDQLPADARLADAIRLGALIVKDAKAYAGQYVGNDLACTNCHINGGQQEGALPFSGIAPQFPAYNTRAGRVISLEDRIRGCFMRSMNGTAPPYDSKELLAEVVTAYDVPREEFYAEFKLPADLPLETPLKDIEPLVPDFSVTAVRDWLAERVAPHQ
jgi:cytochrome c